MAPIDDSACRLLEFLPLAAVDSTTAIRLLSRALHVLCAIILGGGVFYMRSVLAPAGLDACFAGRRQVWARWVAIASTILLASGLFNYISYIRASKLPDATPLPSAYHMLFGMKFMLGLFVMFVAALIAGKSAAADKARGNLSMWLNGAWISVMALVILGAVMRFYH